MEYADLSALSPTGQLSPADKSRARVSQNGASRTSDGDESPEESGDKSPHSRLVWSTPTCRRFLLRVSCHPQTARGPASARTVRQGPPTATSRLRKAVTSHRTPDSYGVRRLVGAFSYGSVVTRRQLEGPRQPERCVKDLRRRRVA